MLLLPFQFFLPYILKKSRKYGSNGKIGKSKKRKILMILMIFKNMYAIFIFKNPLTPDAQINILLERHKPSCVPSLHRILNVTFLGVKKMV